MKKITFNNITNFYTNIYPEKDVIVESWRGTVLPQWKRSIAVQGERISAALGSILERHDMVSYENAPAALRTKFAEGWVFVDIPEKSLEKITGIQKSGAGYPGAIIGYNAEDDVALVLFDTALNTGKMYNTYPVKFLNPITDEREFGAKFNYDIKRLKDTLRPLGIAFTSSRTYATGSLQLSSGIHTETSCILGVETERLRVGATMIRSLRLKFKPRVNLDSDEGNNLTTTELVIPLLQTSPEVLRSIIKQSIKAYNDEVKLTVPLAEAMAMINTACGISMITSGTVNEPGGGKFISVALSRGNTFKNIKGLGLDISQTNNGLNISDKIPDQLSRPVESSFSFSIKPQKDKATGKKFLIIDDAIFGTGFFTKDNTIYKELQTIIRTGNSLPDETKNTIKIYNDLTKDGKIMFFKYLLRKYGV